MPEQNQLLDNVTLVQQDDIRNLLDALPVGDQERPWRSYDVWLLTIVTNKRADKMTEEEVDRYTQFLMDLLNNQENFLVGFFHMYKNKAWTGDLDPRHLPLNIEDFDYLHMTYSPEIAPATNFLHVHISLVYAIRPTYGLSCIFNKPLLSRITKEIFGYSFHIDYRVRRADQLAIQFYNEKAQRNE